MDVHNRSVYISEMEETGEAKNTHWRMNYGLETPQVGNQMVLTGAHGQSMEGYRFHKIKGPLQ
jgi:hypothetical protein